MDSSNKLALDVWEATRKTPWPVSAGDVAKLVEMYGGTVEDFDRVMTIETIFRRINGR